MPADIRFPLRSLQIRSKVNDDATIRISLEPVEITEPSGNEVVVRVEAAPVNPSDLGLMLGGVPADTFTPCGDGEMPALCAPIPEGTFARLQNRVGQSLPVGLEGMGTVLAAGPDASNLLGKKVSMFGSGIYSQYQKMSADSCLVLPDDVNPESGAAAFANPVTALAMVDTMHREGHTAMVHTAAASNLGQMMVRICKADGIALVNIVRSEEQVRILKDLGAEFVCNSSLPSFTEDLIEAIRETGATLAFDAVGGGDLASQILSAMEKAVNQGNKPYSRYGSDVYKHVYVYGGLDPSPLVLHKDFGLAWGLSGWLVTTVLAKIGPEAADLLKARVLRELDTTFASKFGQSVGLIGLFEPEKLVAAGARSTGGKFLIEPNAA